MGSNKLKTLEDRVWAKIKKTDTCWLWIGAKLNTGYGQLGRSKNCIGMSAHRAILEVIGRKIPKGMCVDHICRVRHCVNPDHLRIVTRGQNSVENSVGITALNKKKTHCPKGHNLYGKNLYRYTDKNGKTVRFCKSCRALSRMKYYRDVECRHGRPNDS